MGSFKGQFSLPRYLTPLAQLLWSFSLECHQFGDDTQLHMLMSSWSDTTTSMLAEDLEVVVWWLNLNWLTLNPMKTEVLWQAREDSGLRCQLPALEGVILTLLQSIESKGAILDAFLSMEAQITNVASWCTTICAKPGNWLPTYPTLILPQ